MSGLKHHRGICAPLLSPNIDTDQIIPSREMKKVSKAGLGEGLFAGWRYRYEGTQKIGVNPEFVLNQAAYLNTSILLGSINFGCGSSREHAVWALYDFGIRVIIAESFGRIFRTNCARNKLLTIELTAAQIEQICNETESAPQTKHLLIDLQRCVVVTPSGIEFSFEINSFTRELLLKNLDHIDYALTYINDIDRHIKRDSETRRWAYLQA